MGGLKVSNQKKEKVMPKGMRQLIALFNLFLDYNCMGLSCFIVDEPLPSSEELALMLSYSAKKSTEDAGRVDGGQDIPQAQSILERADVIERLIQNFGGIDTFRASFAFFAALEAEASKRSKGRVDRYKLLKDLSEVGTSRFPSNGSVAFYHHITERNMRDERKKALSQIAKDIYFKRKYTEKKAA